MLAEVAQLRDLRPATHTSLRQRAARVERAAGRRADHARWLAWNRLQPLLLALEPREAVHEPDGVRMARIAEERVDVAELDDAPRVHDDDAVGELGDEAEIVGDEDDGGVRLALGRLDHLHDLSLDRHVERCRRLVGDEHRRRVGDGHGDHAALPHSARELVRVLVEALLGIGHADERRAGRRRAAPPRRRRRRVVRADRLGDLITDPEHRVERRHRVLEDHRHLAAADLAELVLGHREQVAALEDRFAAHDPAGRLRDQPEHREHGHALARARLADDAEHLAGEEVVADAGDGLHDAVLRLELDRQVVDREDRLRGHGAEATRNQGCEQA